MSGATLFTPTAEAGVVAVTAVRAAATAITEAVRLRSVLAFEEPSGDTPVLEVVRVGVDMGNVPFWS
jgi:hypothetical protein